VQGRSGLIAFVGEGADGRGHKWDIQMERGKSESDNDTTGLGTWGKTGGHSAQTGNTKRIPQTGALPAHRQPNEYSLLLCCVTSNYVDLSSVSPSHRIANRRWIGSSGSVGHVTAKSQ
jgi:hypothetical protein